LTFELILWHELSDEINRLPQKTRRIIRAGLKRLEEEPLPGTKGDKEKLILRGGIVIYLLHISRSYTVFYEIDKEQKRVIVQEILPIEQAHIKYGYY
jgi:mRNA interferase RelE/StbE